jgi:hypothetical protein
MTTTFRPALLAIVAAALLVQGAAAQPPVGRDPGDRLRRADADGDGRVTRDEFIKARSSELEAAFARLDADGNGAIDDKEMAAAAERMRSAGGREGRDGPPRPAERPRRAEGTGPDGERPQRADGERPRRPDGERPVRSGRPGAGPGGEEAFNRLDRDGDGSLSRGEFAEGRERMRELMQRNGPPPAGPGSPDRPDRGDRGPEQGFRRPPQQD